MEIAIVLRGLPIYFLLLLIIIGGCSTYSSNPLSSSYNNLTAHYNAYFIANERIKEIESTLYESYQWNYNKVLPIYIPVDSNDAKSLKTQIEDCIEKASIAIQRHEGSKWEDDSYILVGKARYYALEYADAIETFKFVNKESEDDNTRHEALIELIKSFVDFQEINNAIAVSDYLKKEELNRKNQKELFLVRAYLYQKRGDYDQMVQNLVKSEELMASYADKGRIDFIIAQVYQELGFEAEAYNYYKEVLKNGPKYELSFYTKLNMAQVTELTSSGDIKRIRKYFRSLLRDIKNVEYKDKIYYEMAGFEFKQGNLDESINYYKESVQASVKNQRQKAYSYLKLGQIYYDSLKNFELAQAYYDSTVSTMPQDEENFLKIKQRAEILDDFVVQIKTIRENDSLIQLTNLPKDSLVALATSIAEKEDKALSDKKESQERRNANFAASPFDTNESELIGTTLGGATWYFYNPSAVSRGISDFNRIWGDIPLEDNWRRSLKAGQLSARETTEEEPQGDVLSEEDAKALRISTKVEEMLSAIPKDQAEIDTLLKEVEIAHYKLGNIYNFSLQEKDNAIKTFEAMLVRFPGSSYEPEVLYQLYLLYKSIDPVMAAKKAEELKAQYPDTIYAKLVDNPNYREENQLITEQLKKVYANAYQLYKDEKYEASKRMLDSAIASTKENEFEDNLALLVVLNFGKLEGQYKYQYELNNYIKTYPESELIPYAKSLVKSSEDYQINLYNSAKAKFINYFDQTHYLVLVYPNKSELSQDLTSEVDEYLDTIEQTFTTGNLILDKEKAMILVNDFPDRTNAIRFMNKFNDELPLGELHKGEKIYSFVISEDNFNIFYQTKDLSAYLNFFENNYTK